MMKRIIALLLISGTLVFSAAGCSETKADGSEQSQAVQSSEGKENSDEKVSSDFSDSNAESAEQSSSADSAQDDSMSTSGEEKPDKESVEKYSGKWSLETDDYVLTIVLADDGNVILSREGVTQEGTWHADGDKLTIHNYGEDTVFIYKDDRLYYETNDKVYLTRGLPTDNSDEEQAQTYSFADQKYIGRWTLLYENSIDENASEINASSLYVNLYKGGIASGVSSGKTLTGTWSSEGYNVSIILQGNEELFTYKDGALYSKDGKHRMFKE